MTTENVFTTGINGELASINKVFYFLNSENSSAPTITVYPSTDRYDFDIDSLSFFNSLSTDITKSVTSIATMLANYQEVHRILRDLDIAKAGHKNIWLSCLRTAMFRYNKLNNLLNPEGT